MRWRISPKCLSVCACFRDRRRGDAEYCPRNTQVRIPGRLLGHILGFHALLIASSSAIGPVLGGTILHTLSWQWLFAINVLPGTLALLLAVSAAAGCDPYAGALRHRGRHIVGAAVGFDDHGGEQPTERYFSIRQPLLDGSRCAERHGFYLANPPHGSSLLPPSMFKNERFTLAAFTSMVAFVSRDHLYCATLPVSERIRLQSGSVCPAVYAVAIRDRADCAACRPLGGHDISPGDIHRAGDICRRFDPAGDVTRQPFNVGYLPAKSGMRNRVWLLSESQ